MSPKLLLVHNRYVHPGGEDIVVENEYRLLKETPWAIERFDVRSEASLRTAIRSLQAPWGGGWEDHLESAIRKSRPDILHAHNLFPLLSPRVFKSAKSAGIRTVLTLHNYRPLCLNGLFLTPSHEVCERCVTAGHFGPGVQRGCYRESRLQSLAQACHISAALRLKWYESIDYFIAPSQFLKDKFVASGWPADKIHVQGHCLAEAPAETPEPPEPYLLYLGRLSEEKGVRWLVDYFRTSSGPLVLRIAGSGPLESYVRAAAGTKIIFYGHIQGDQKRQMMRRAMAVVMPSECYENFPLVVTEANASGTPLLASDQGALREMVRSEQNGERFEPKNAASFVSALENIMSQGNSLRRRSLEHAREHYSKQRWTEARMAFYSRVLEDLR